MSPLFPLNELAERFAKSSVAAVRGRGTLHVPSYRIDTGDEFTIAMGYGTSDASSLAEGRFEYWALGGEHNRKLLEGGASAGAVYCGSPQGRSLDEAGAAWLHAR